MRNGCCIPLLLLLLLLPLLFTPPAGDAAVITGACDKDPQCGGGMCCAVSIWVKSIRICTPMGKVGDNCHPLTRKDAFPCRLLPMLIFLNLSTIDILDWIILCCEDCPVDCPADCPVDYMMFVNILGLYPLNVPYFGRRMHHMCPCMPGLACLRASFNRFVCLARK